MVDKKLTKQDKKAKKEAEIKEIVVVTQKDVNEAVQKNPDMKWFIIQTYSGKDMAAKRSIETRLKAAGVEDDVGIIVMAEKKVSELRNGQMKVVKKRLYPSYLYFYAKTLEDNNIYMDEAVYGAIQGSANLHGFIGQDNAKFPKSIINKVEIGRMISQLQADDETVEQSFKFKEGDDVVAISGSISGVTGKVASYNVEKGVVSVEVDILGKSTKIDFLVDQLVLKTDS